MWDFIKENGLEGNVMKHLRALGCDGTNANTGLRNGINHHFEVFLGRELHWFVCLLHLIELVMKNLLRVVLGDTKYIGYKSKIGQDIKSETLHQRPIVDFETISCDDFPDFRSKGQVGSSIHNDQLRFYNTCLALIHGDEEHIKAVRSYKVGAIGHARWLTTMDRIATLYMTMAKPPAALKMLVQFGVKVYGATFFEIKQNPSFTEGPRFFWKIANRINEKVKYKFVFPEYARKSVYSTLAQNSYWAHSENVLLAMICDKDQAIRKKGIRCIEVVRANFIYWKRKEAEEREVAVWHAANAGKKRGRPKKETEPEVVRTFHKPTDSDDSPGAKLNFRAAHYSELIRLAVQIHEPPMTKGFTLEQLARFKAPALSNHSQIVEHYVQKVSKEALAVSKEDERNANVFISAFHSKYMKKGTMNDKFLHLQNIENLRKAMRKGYKKLAFDVSTSLEELFLFPSAEVQHDVEMEFDDGLNEKASSDNEATEDGSIEDLMDLC